MRWREPLLAPLQQTNPRTAIDQAERECMHLTIARIPGQKSHTMALLSRRSLTVADEAAIHRRVVRRALVELGMLSVTRRLITLPLKPTKRARII